MEFAIEKLQTPKPHWFFREEKGFTSESAIGPGQSQVSQFGEYIEEKKSIGNNINFFFHISAFIESEKSLIVGIRQWCYYVT